MDSFECLHRSSLPTPCKGCGGAVQLDHPPVALLAVL